MTSNKKKNSEERRKKKKVSLTPNVIEWLVTVISTIILSNRKIIIICVSPGHAHGIITLIVIISVSTTLTVMIQLGELGLTRIAPSNSGSNKAANFRVFPRAEPCNGGSGEAKFDCQGPAVVHRDPGLEGLSVHALVASKSECEGGRKSECVNQRQTKQGAKDFSPLGACILGSDPLPHLRDPEWNGRPIKGHTGMLVTQGAGWKGSVHGIGGEGVKGPEEIVEIITASQHSENPIFHLIREKAPLIPGDQLVHPRGLLKRGKTMTVVYSSLHANWQSWVLLEPVPDHLHVQVQERV